MRDDFEYPWGWGWGNVLRLPHARPRAARRMPRGLRAALNRIDKKPEPNHPDQLELFDLKEIQ